MSNQTARARTCLLLDESRPKFPVFGQCPHPVLIPGSGACDFHLAEDRERRRRKPEVTMRDVRELSLGSLTTELVSADGRRRSVPS